MPRAGMGPASPKHRPLEPHDVDTRFSLPAVRRSFQRRSRRIQPFVVVAALAASTAAHAQLALAQQKGCTACHAVDTKVVGPAYHDVALKYKSRKDAPDYLTQKVIKGGAGVWGPVPMPPNAESEAEARQLVQWILSLP